jgi:glycosyltransferase involved in cell wall biosynthesis
MRRALGGIDAYPALSEPVARELRELGGDPARTRVLSYGPQPDWYPKPDGLGRGVIAAGTMKRDFETLAQALSRTQVPGWIVCRREMEPKSSPGPRTQVLSHESGAGMSLASLLELYARARVIAIPLKVHWPWTINGLTSLADALGLGKPVIMTRNSLFDLDLEGLGIGITVEPGDVEGWRAAIEHLDQHPEVAAEMGARARALVDEGICSSRTFGRELSQIFDRVIAAGGSVTASA